MLKRLSGSEFCSDAHLRQYQQEFSELALSRLLQAVPSDQTPPRPALARQAPPLRPEEAREELRSQQPRIEQTEPRTAPREALKHPVPAPVPAVAETAAPHSGTHPAKAEPATVAAAEQPPSPGATDVAPRRLASLLIHKPAAAIPRAGEINVSESELLVPTVAPVCPGRAGALAATELCRAAPVAWRRGWEIQNAAVHPVEAALEVRSLARPAPVMDFDLRIDGPQEWLAADSSVEDTAVRSAAPGEAVLWKAPPCDFIRRAPAAGDLYDTPLPPVEPEEAGIRPEIRKAAAEPPSTPGGIPEPPAAAGGPAMQDEPAPPRPAELSAPALLPAVPLPELVKETAADRGIPVPMFAAWAGGVSAPRIARPEALPLRPVMVLAPAGSESSAKSSPDPVVPAADGATAHGSAPAHGKSRKADVRILPPEKPDFNNGAAKPAPPPVELPRTTAAREPMRSPAPIRVSVAASTVQADDLGLPEFRMQTSRFSLSRRMWLMLGLAVVVLTLAAIFLFANTKADDVPIPGIDRSRAEKTPRPALRGSGVYRAGMEQPGLNGAFRMAPQDGRN